MPPLRPLSGLIADATAPASTVCAEMFAPAVMGNMFRLLLNQDIGLVPSVLGLFGAEVSLFGADIGVTLSATTVLPPLIFALFAQRYLVRGLFAGAVEG